MGLRRVSVAFCRPALGMCVSSVDLSFFYVVLSPDLLPARAAFLALKTAPVQPLRSSASKGAGRGVQPHPCKSGGGCVVGAGAWLWARAAPRAASLSVSVFLPRKTRSVLALSPGGLEGFPHTVLRSSANEGPGNAKCSRGCACQQETGHHSQKPVASPSSRRRRSRPLGRLPMDPLQGLLEIPGALPRRGHLEPGRALPARQPRLLRACFSFCSRGLLNPDGEGHCWKDLTRQLPVPHAPLYEGASARRLL